MFNSIRFNPSPTFGCSLKRCEHGGYKAVKLLVNGGANIKQARDWVDRQAPIPGTVRFTNNITENTICRTKYGYLERVSQEFHDTAMFGLLNRLNKPDGVKRIVRRMKKSEEKAEKNVEKLELLFKAIKAKNVTS